MTSWLLFQNSFILRRLTVAIFVDIIKIASIFTKTIVKDSKKFERIRNYVSKWNLYFYFLIQQNFQFPVKKLWHQQNSGCVQPDSYIYCIFFRCAKSHHCRICVRDFREGDFLARPPPSLSSPEKAHSE